MDFTHEAVKMAGALALVIFVLLGGLAWMRRVFGEVGGQGSAPIMRILGGLRLGAGKQIMLVEVSGEVLVIGTTPREVTLLTKIVEEDRVSRLRSIAHPLVGRIGPWLGFGKLAQPDVSTSSTVSTPSAVNSIPKC